MCRLAGSRLWADLVRRVRISWRCVSSCSWERCGLIDSGILSLQGDLGVAGSGGVTGALLAGCRALRANAVHAREWLCC